MAYVQPYTDICLLRDVPLDNTYDNTLTFTSKAAQFAYFYSKRVKYITANSYQRTMKGTLRIACSMDEAIQCNYLYFNNRNHEDKIFYAFITGWEYVNEETTEISYEIDVFQSFWFDVRLLDVFVEREHDNTDTMWSNTVPENLEQGEYVSNYETAILPSNSGNTCIFYTTFNDDGNFSDFTVHSTSGDIEYVSGIVTGLNVIVKPNGVDAETPYAFLQRVIDANKSDGVIAMYMCPFVPSTYAITQENKQFPKIWGTLDGYSPKNNKLYTYPYNLLHIQTDVQGADFRYEFFTDAGNQCNFILRESLIPQPSITLIPSNYAGRTGANGGEFRLTISDFPQCAWNADVFKVYLAQNASSLPTKMIGQAASAAIGVAGLMAGDISGFQAVASASSGILNTLAQLHDISTKPPQQNGTQTATADYGMGYKNFMLERLSIRAEYARIIDDYFDMFGYATKRVKQPNITGRPHWNYVKTIGTTVDALGVPAPYLTKMNQCFNKGITFWHNPDEVGSYTTLDNRPV